MIRKLAAPLAAATLLMTALTACSTGSTATSDGERAATAADAEAFPVTIEHAFGATTIDEEPTRVATIGWTDQDHALALGVVPVGATKLGWGGNDAGSSDWFDEELADGFEDAEAPVRYDDTDGVPIDEIARLGPDLILATNSGITEAEYKKLSKIADVVAYPEAPWVTPWQTSLDLTGRALGRSALADEVEQEALEDIEQAREEHSEIVGKSVIFAYLAATDLSQIGVYAPEDPRMGILQDFGMTSPDHVGDLVDDGAFYATVSAERAATLESDVLLTYAETSSDLDVFAKDKLVGQIPALRSGHVHAEVDKHIGLAVTNPTPLSIPYIADTFLPAVAKAAAGR